LTYFIVNRLKRAEGIDVYDRNTNFSPFARNRAVAAVYDRRGQLNAALTERRYSGV
jgi:hypothetical protein